MEIQNNPFVSIVVPVYNLGQYVESFVESLKAQTYSDFEAVIVNDGSTDNSLEMIHKHICDDKRFVVISTENQGELFARKTGIERAKAKYVTFLDADDILMPEVIERMVDVIKPDYDIVCCNIKRICLTYEAPVRETQTEDMNGIEFLESIISHKVSGTNCAKLYNKELFNKITYIPMRLGGDYLLNIQIACLMPRVRFIDYVGYGYVQRAGSSNHTPFDYDYMELYSKMVEQELYKHNDTLGGRAEFLALLNKLRWYKVYASKSRNRWIGGSEFAENVEKLISKHKLELKQHYSSGALLFISLYSYRLMHTPLILYTTVMRWYKSLKRRIAK